MKFIKRVGVGHRETLERVRRGHGAALKCPQHDRIEKGKQYRPRRQIGKGFDVVDQYHPGQRGDQRDGRHNTAQAGEKEKKHRMQHGDKLPRL